MFNFKKILIAVLVVSLISEEVASHKLLLGAAHIKKKIILAKLHLIRPIARALAVKKIIGLKVLGAKALLAAKLGIGAAAIGHLRTGLRGAAPGVRTATPESRITSVKGVQRSLPVLRSSLTFPEINVPVRFSVGGAGPAIRSDVRSEISKTVTRQAAKV